MILWIFFTEINSSKTTMDNSGRMLVRVVTRAIRDKLPEVMASEAWVWLPESVIMELLEDSSLQVTEGQLFDGIVNWCRANTGTEQEAIDKYQHCFAEKMVGKNISIPEWLNVFRPLNEFIPDKQFGDWTFLIFSNYFKEATTRSDLNPDASPDAGPRDTSSASSAAAPDPLGTFSPLAPSHKAGQIAEVCRQIFHFKGQPFWSYLRLIKTL